jgi:hypothetical protein
MRGSTNSPGNTKNKYVLTRIAVIILSGYSIIIRSK